MKNHLALGLITGLIAGGVYRLLNTPRSGKENQEMAKDYLDDATYHVEDVTEKVKELKTAVSQLTNEGKTLATAFASDMDKTAKDFMYEAEPRIRRIQEKAEVLQKDVEETSEKLAETAPSKD